MPGSAAPDNAHLNLSEARYRKLFRSESEPRLHLQHERATAHCGRLQRHIAHLLKQRSAFKTTPISASTAPLNDTSKQPDTTASGSLTLQNGLRHQL